jgi:hypothetical protein
MVKPAGEPSLRGRLEPELRAAESVSSKEHRLTVEETSSAEPRQTGDLPRCRQDPRTSGKLLIYNSLTHHKRQLSALI